MTDRQKEEMKKAFLVFLKAMIAPTIAFVTSILTILVSGEPSVAIGTAAGTVSGTIAQIITHAAG